MHASVSGCVGGTVLHCDPLLVGKRGRGDLAAKRGVEKYRVDHGGTGFFLCSLNTQLGLKRFILINQSMRPRQNTSTARG